MRFSEEEISQLIKAWAAISLAFTIAGTIGSGRGVSDNSLAGFLPIFLISVFTVGLAFLLHELAHKFLAQRYGCWAEFRSFDMGLLLAFIMSFAGMIFAAPGAVVISGVVSTKEHGKIAAVGPLTNIILAAVFYVVGMVVPLSDWVGEFVRYGISINAWLAVFNLIPIWNLDGLKVISWSGIAWLLLMAGGVILLFI
jgi:Zn-dependent protease